MKVILSGVCGKMGHHVLEALSTFPDMNIVAGVDKESNDDYPFPVYSSWTLITEKADVIIDFSHHSVVNNMLDFIDNTSTPAVICTTGLNEEQVQRIATLSHKTALLRSGNMSLGVNLLTELVSKAAEVLFNQFDVEIIEKHHNRKVDAPSGTALMLADAAKNSIPENRYYTYGRQGNDCKRKKEEIGIHAIRGGTIVGDHSVIFSGPDEIIELNHVALSRGVFATGAVHAARYITNKTNGFYTMKDVLK